MQSIISTPYIPTKEETEMLQKALVLMIAQTPVTFSKIGLSWLETDSELSSECVYRINGIHADLTISLYDEGTDNIFHEFPLSHFNL